MSIPMLTDADIRRAWPRDSGRYHPGDCSACGSQEFLHWQGRSVCAYCRSVAAPSARQTPTYDRYFDHWMRTRVSVPVIRPNAHARLTID